MRDECVRVTAIKSICVHPIGVLTFTPLLRFGVGVYHGVATSLLELEALLLTHEEAQRGVEVAPRLYYLNDIGLVRHVLSCKLKSSFMSVSFAALAETKPLGK